MLASDEKAAVDARIAELRIVGGEALARRVMQRFDRQLAELDDGAAPWTSALAHRTAGLAGMLGFERLAALCGELEIDASGRPQLLSQALRAVQDARSELQRRLQGE